MRSSSEAVSPARKWTDGDFAVVSRDGLTFHIDAHYLMTAR